MPDPRSAMKEYRFLEQKRVALGLTLDEEYRLAELRDLVGPELERARRPGPGFDVNAAAARLRASLEAAGPGRRAAASVAPSIAGDEADALLDAALAGGEVSSPGGWVGDAYPETGAAEAGAGLPWATDAAALDPTATYAVPEPRWDPPGAAVDLGAAVAPDASFSGGGQGWGPSGGQAPADPADPFAGSQQGWDPDAYVEPVDPGAPHAAGVQAAWDPSAYAEPGAAPVDPGEPYAAGEQAAWDANAYAEPGAAPVDPGEPHAAGEQAAWDANAYAEPGAAPVDPGEPHAAGEPAAWDANAYAEPGAASVDPGAPYAAGEPAAWDPNAYAEPGAASVDPGAPYAAGEPAAWDPSAYAEPGAAAVDPGAPYAAGEQAAWDPSAYAEPGAAAVDPGAPYAAGEQAAWDPSAYAEPGTAPVEPVAPYTAGEQASAPDAGAAPDAPAIPGLEPLSLEGDLEPPEASPRPGRAWPMGASPAEASRRLPELSLEDDPAAEPTAPPASGDAADLPPEGWDASAPPPTAPLELTLGEYDEPAAATVAGAPLDPLGALGPVDLAAEPSPEPAAARPGLEVGDYDALAPAPPAADVLPDPLELLDGSPAPVHTADADAGAAPSLGEYDDTSGFEAPAGAFALGDPDPSVEAGSGMEGGVPDAALDGGDAEASFGALFDEADLAHDPGAPAAVTAPGAHDDAAESAFRLGFELASGGSFEAAADAAVPEWASAGAPAAWEAGPADPLDPEPSPVAVEEGDDLDGPVLELEEAGAVLDVDEAGALELDAGAASPALTAPTDLAAPARSFEDSSGAEPAEPRAADPGSAPLPHGDLASTAAAREPDTRERATTPALWSPEPPPEAEALPALDLASLPDLAAAPAHAAPEPSPEADPLPPLDLAFLPDLGAAPARAAPGPAAEVEPLPPLDLGSPDLPVTPDPAPTFDPAGALEVEALAELADLDPAAEAGGSRDVAPAPDVDAAPELASLPGLGALPDLGADVDLDDLPTLEGDLLEEIPADELLPLDEPAEAPPAPVPSTSAGLARAGHVPGGQRVIIHTMEGLSRRGLLEDADLGAETLLLLPQAGGAPEPVPTARVKAIFFMLAPGESGPPPAGRRLHVTFKDGREVAGFSPDYSDRRAGFFMFPADPRTNTARIWIYQAAVKQVAVSKP